MIKCNTDKHHHSMLLTCSIFVLYLGIVYAMSLFLERNHFLMDNLHIDAVNQKIDFPTLTLLRSETPLLHTLDVGAINLQGSCPRLYCRSLFNHRRTLQLLTNVCLCISKAKMFIFLNFKNIMEELDWWIQSVVDNVKLIIHLIVGKKKSQKMPEDDIQKLALMSATSHNVRHISIREVIYRRSG